MRAAVTAQCVECLLHKLEGLRSDLQHPRMKTSIAVHACNPSIIGMETRKSLELADLLSSQLFRPRFSEETLLQQ